MPQNPSVGQLSMQWPKAKAADAAKGIVAGAKANIMPGNVAPIDYVDIARQKAELAARENQKKARAALAADYAVARGVKALDRNLQDSRSKFQTQRNQVDADEAKALDNQVLYAEARGDRGGIGKTQYGGIQNTAATNRQVVNSAEVKLQTDTARQIADLRAQGEFEKADKVLEISNKYLTELQAAKLFGVSANGAETANYRNAVADRYAEGARAMMNAGIVQSASQLETMGWTPEQYWIYRMANSSY